MPGIPAATNIAMMDRFLDLAEAGVDWLAEAIAACRHRGISPWTSVRMNDMHGAADPVGNPINCPLFADPRYRLKGVAMNPRTPDKPYWRALSYEHAEVRDYMMTMIRELVGDYDVAGLELDFLRNPAICEPGCSQQTVDTVTEWIAGVRVLAREKEAQTGRPFPFGLRIPGQLPMLHHIGLDVKALVRAGLVDFLCASNFMQTSWDMPHDELRTELGEDVAIYGVVELIFNGVCGTAPGSDQAYSRYPCASAPALHGNAAGKLVLGADGIQLYNYYAADEDNADERIVTTQNERADYTAIRGVSDLESLRGLPKHYGVGTLRAPCWYPPFERPEPLPVTLAPEERRAFRLPMCAEPADGELRVTEQIVFERAAAPPDIGVSLNGSWPSFGGTATEALLFPNRPATIHLPGHQAVNFQFDPALLREGWNEITVYNGALGDDDGAAEELRHHLSLMTGASLPIVAESDPRLSPYAWAGVRHSEHWVSMPRPWSAKPSSFGSSGKRWCWLETMRDPARASRSMAAGIRARCTPCTTSSRTSSAVAGSGPGRRARSSRDARPLRSVSYPSRRPRSSSGGTFEPASAPKRVSLAWSTIRATCRASSTTSTRR